MEARVSVPVNNFAICGSIKPTRLAVRSFASIFVERPKDHATRCWIQLVWIRTKYGNQHHHVGCVCAINNRPFLASCPISAMVAPVVASGYIGRSRWLYSVCIPFHFRKADKQGDLRVTTIQLCVIPTWQQCVC